MNVLKRLSRAIKRDGIRYFIIRSTMRILRYPERDNIQEAKTKVFEILNERYRMVVAYGPFKGMKLNPNVWWSTNDLNTQMLGIYEQHVLEQIVTFSEQGSKKFIDIGAADGYFCIGAAYGNLFESVSAFEISEDGQKRIVENAINNGCEEKVDVFGLANYDSLLDQLSGIKNSTILIDIEGDEFEFLSEKMLHLLKDQNIICELHPWRRETGYAQQDQLIDNAKIYFDVKIIKRDWYNPNQFFELDDLTDEERLIAVGEERKKNMKWLVLTPRT